MVNFTLFLRRSFTNKQNSTVQSVTGTFIYEREGEEKNNLMIFPWYRDKSTQRNMNKTLNMYTYKTDQSLSNLNFSTL